jgi:hypothetical protein
MTVATIPIPRLGKKSHPLRKRYDKSKKHMSDGIINNSTPSANTAISSPDFPSLCIQRIARIETIGMLANRDAKNILRFEVSVISTIIATVQVILAR